MIRLLSIVGLLAVVACGRSSTTPAGLRCANDREFCPGACNPQGYCEQDLGWGPEVRVPKGTYVVFFRGRLSDGMEESSLVTFPSSYWIDKREMSVGLAKKCGDCGVTSIEADTQPAQVTRAQAVAVCAAGGRRLPSNYEWEAAGRGPTICTDPAQLHPKDPTCNGRVFPWTVVYADPEDICARALIEDCGKPTGPRPVADHPEGASPLGVQEMIGNVTEWISNIEQVIGWASYTKEDRGIVKGGDWATAGEAHSFAYVTLIIREYRKPDKLSGLRCVRGPFIDVRAKLRPSAFDDPPEDAR